MESCCQNAGSNKKSAWSGIIYGLIPHTFCIAFFILPLVGAVGGAALAKKFLILPHFFLFLTIISLLSATLAAFFYLKKNSCCSSQGIKKKAGYILTLYSTTILTNILVAYIIIPALISNPTQPAKNDLSRLSAASIEVQIPCPGHAPLITDELKKISGVEEVSFNMPRTFKVVYDPKETSLKNIEASEIFKTFKIRTN